MSRAFVKEDDQEENPIIPERAPLPTGITNYVTPVGLILLKEELKELEIEKNQIPAQDTPERRAAFKIVAGKINMLIDRINSAEVVEISNPPPFEVRFGATVTFKFEDENISRTFQIVGVDEADVKKKKIAFTSPIARAMIGKKQGDEVVLNLEHGTRHFSIEKVEYIV